MSKIFTFLNEVKAEVYKINWPGRDELIGTVIVVLIVTAAFAAILGAMDAVFSLLLKKIF